MENEQTPKRNWKEFTVTPPPVRTGLYASISPSGRIALNRKLWELAGAPTHVSLVYDDENNNAAIGVRPESPLMPNTFPIATRPCKAATTWIRAREFMTKANIDISYCVRFLDPHIEDGVLVLDLNHTTQVIGSRKQ